MTKGNCGRVAGVVSDRFAAPNVVGAGFGFLHEGGTNGRKFLGWVLLRSWVAFSLLLCLGLVPGVDAAERIQLSGHLPVGLEQLAPREKLPANQEISLAIGLPLRDLPALTNLLQEIYDPSSFNYRRYLTPTEFAARFGPTEQD